MSIRCTVLYASRAKELERIREKEARYEAVHIGNYRRIYPVAGRTEKYDELIVSAASAAGSLFTETAAFKARVECAKQLREEIARKAAPVLSSAAQPLEPLLNRVHQKDRLLKPEGSPDRRGATLSRRPGGPNFLNLNIDQRKPPVPPAVNRVGTNHYTRI